LRIVFVCKRYYTGKDVVCHRFGRLYELPSQLARLGHQVVVLALDYRAQDHHPDFTEHFGSGFVRWTIITRRTIIKRRVSGVYRGIEAFNPSLVFGSSDIPCLWLSRKIAGKLKIPFVVDLYDNYESFGQAKIPGLRNVLRSCVRKANLVVTVSSVLRQKVIDEDMPCSPVIVMNNGVARSSFFPGDCSLARLSLGLPLKVKLIGTAGTLSKMKGLDTVYEAWPSIRDLAEDVYLVLAGPKERGFPLPAGERVIYLGELLEERVGQLFRALDVGIIPAHDSAFGRYCFPQKLFEMMACELPVVGARVGAIEAVLQSSPEMLFSPGDAESLTAAVSDQLREPKLSDITPREWGELVERIEPVIAKLVK